MRMIDADAVKAMIYEKIPLNLFMMRTIEGAQQSMGELRGMIDELPTIEAEPVKHGRWIDTENNSSISGYCSSCGWKAHMYEDDVIGMPYCPNCGARMDGGRDDATD